MTGLSFPKPSYRPGCGPGSAKASPPPSPLPVAPGWILRVPQAGFSSAEERRVLLSSGTRHSPASLLAPSAACLPSPHPRRLIPIKPSAGPGMTSRPTLPAAPPGVLRGAGAGFGAAVILSVRSSNWIPNTQGSAKTLGRGESKGRAIQQIKRGILPGPQRLQHEGWEGTLSRSCPSGGGRGGESPSRRQRLEGPLSSSLVRPHLCSHGALGLDALLPAVGGPGTPHGLASYSAAPGSILEMEQEGSGLGRTWVWILPCPLLPLRGSGKPPSVLWPQFPPLWAEDNISHHRGQGPGCSEVTSAKCLEDRSRAQ